MAQLKADGFEDAVEIGRGGFGVVYRCLQVELDRAVAVKVLTLDLDENRPRFEREQRAMARLTGHPNIVPVLQIGQTYAGHPYLVMPYFRQGCIHTEIARQGRLPLEETLRIGVKIAAALESAHQLQILHRDVKPANVLITDYGDPALTDFGIAHIAGGYKTTLGTFAGSPAFTAPEVLRGDEPDRTSDVYSLGATLYCALTGSAPFERRTGESAMAQCLRITTSQPPLLNRDDIPDDMAAVVNSAISAKPRDRPSAAEFGEQVQRLQAAHKLRVDEMHLPGMTRTTGPIRAVAAESMARPRGNLPAPVTGFVGREAELSELSALISATRLVTLTGIGGVGKTTLALHAAREKVDHFDDGVWLVELGDVSDGSLLAGVVATALGIRDAATTPVAEVMVNALADRTMLLILDNCEHVIDAAAQLAETLLQGCPRLQILATSREVLGIGAESVIPLRPLPYPDSDSALVPRKLNRYDAIALFVERARTASPGFTLTQHNAAAVTRIVAQLDGLPLAIELAAARLRAMSVDQIADRLSDRFGLLTRGRRGAPTRQQTLSWCMDWSYDRCSPTEQRLWSRLSVFAGSFELDAARHICAGDMSVDDLLDELCALVDKSILIRTEHHDMVRFRLLTTIREYGQNHIGSREEYTRLQRRHLDWYRQLLRQFRAEYFTKNQVRWLNRLRREIPNIQEAMQFALANSPDDLLLMAADMRHSWTATGMLNEGRRWLEAALNAASPEPTPQRIAALAALTRIALFQADRQTAATCAAEANELLAQIPDPATQGLNVCGLGFGALIRGEVERARILSEQAIAITDDFEVQTLSMMTLSWSFAVTGDGQSALEWAERGLALAEPRREALIRSYMLGAAGVSRFALGDQHGARRVLNEGLRLCLAAEDPWTGAQFLEVLAWVAGPHDPRRSVVLMAASIAVSRACGAIATVMAFAGAFHENCEREARERLSPAEFEKAWEQGDSLSFEGAAAFALTEYA